MYSRVFKSVSSSRLDEELFGISAIPYTLVDGEHVGCFLISDIIVCTNSYHTRLVDEWLQELGCSLHSHHTELSTRLLTERAQWSFHQPELESYALPLLSSQGWIECVINRY